MRNIRLVPPKRTIRPASALEVLWDMLPSFVAVLIALGLPVWAHWWVTH